MKRFLAFVVLFVWVLLTKAQVQTMGNGNSFTCGVTFESSGGYAPGAGYSNGENLQYTFYPGPNGSAVSLDFVAFSLGAGDILTVYDGDNSSAGTPIIGVYDQTSPLLGTITANVSVNYSGALTFVFISDATDVSDGWQANLSCNPVCQNYNLQFGAFMPDTNALGFLDICLGDTAIAVVFGDYINNDSTYHQSDATSSFFWILEDDTISYSSQLEYPFDSIGGGRIQVFSYDSNNCLASYNLNLIYRVGTEPDYSGVRFDSDTICFGDTSYFSIRPKPTEWSNAINNVDSTSVSLADKPPGPNPGVYYSTLNLNGYPNGSTVATINDLVRIWMDIEHSYLGDLQMEITCPNGSNAILKANPGGGGTWLGEACDGSLGIPGIGYMYEWLPAGNTYISMVPYSGPCVACPNVNNPCGGGFPTQTLPSGSYNPSGALTNLVGCPVNGPWELKISDYLTSDDGYIFSWGIEFASNLNPVSVVTYAPGIDSVWVANDSTNPVANSLVTFSSQDSMVIYPLVDSAEYCYSVSVLDSFGCAHDSTICFFVRDRCDPVCYTPVSPSFTKNKVSCIGGSDGSILTSPNPGQIPMPWSYIFMDDTGDTVHTNIGSVLPDSVGGLVEGIYTLQIIDGNGCSSYWPINLGTVSPFTMSVAGNRKTKCFGTGCDGVANANVFSGNPPYNYNWSSGDTTFMTTNLCAGPNFLIVEDSKGCLDTVDFVVTEPDPITGSISLDDTICVSNIKTLIANGSGGVPPYSYDWGAGAQALNSNDVSPVIPTTFSVTISDINNCPPSIESVHIHVRQLLGMTFNGVDTICPGDSMDLICRPFGGDSLFNYSWSDGLGTDAVANVIGGVPQFYTVTLSDGCGTPAIEDSIWIQVGGYPSITVDINATDTICQGERYYMSAQGIGGVGTYTYEWDNGLGFGQHQYDSPTTPTTYRVTVTDDCLTDPGYGEVNLDFGEYYHHKLIPDTNQLCDPATFVFGWDTLNPSFEYFVDYGKGFEEVIGLDSISKDLDDDGCYDIRAKLITKYGCATIKEYDCLVEVLTTPIAQFDFSSHNPDVIENYVEFWDESKYAASWWWYSNDEFLDSNQNFSASFPNKGDNIIKLVVASEAGCFDSTTTNMRVQEVTSYFFPSAFTPNGDGLNDEFKIQGEGVRDEEFEITIYDRWGDVVYLGKSRDQGWNGLQNNSGNALPTGTYSYYYSLLLHDGRRYGSTGTVHLIR